MIEFVVDKHMGITEHGIKERGSIRPSHSTFPKKKESTRLKRVLFKKILQRLEIWYVLSVPKSLLNKATEGQLIILGNVPWLDFGIYY